MYAITVCVSKEIDTDFVFSSNITFFCKKRHLQYVKFTMLMQWCEGEFLSVNKYLLI